MHEVNQKLIDRRAHREQRRPSTVAVSSEQEDANEADIEEEEEEDEEEDIEADGDDEQDDANHRQRRQHGEEKKQRDAPRLGEHYRQKLVVFLEDIRSSCETFAGNSPVVRSSLSSPASGLVVEPGTFDRVYGGDCSEVVLGLLKACLLGSNADQLSNSRRSLARRAGGPPRGGRVELNQ